MRELRSFRNPTRLGGIEKLERKPGVLTELPTSAYKQFDLAHPKKRPGYPLRDRDLFTFHSSSSSFFYFFFVFLVSVFRRRDPEGLNLPPNAIRYKNYHLIFINNSLSFLFRNVIIFQGFFIVRGRSFVAETSTKIVEQWLLELLRRTDAGRCGVEI